MTTSIKVYCQKCLNQITGKHEIDEGKCAIFTCPPCPCCLPAPEPTWHPHHDVIVAWAKGAKIEFRDIPAVPEWSEAPNPSWTGTREYRVKPDNAAEIAEIEQEMRKLADRLEKLK